MAKYLNFSITGYKKNDYFCIINLTSDERKLGMPVLNRYEQPVFCACFPFRKFFFSEKLQCRAAATFSKEKLPVCTCGIDSSFETEHYEFISRKISIPALRYSCRLWHELHEIILETVKTPHVVPHDRRSD